MSETRYSDLPWVFHQDPTGRSIQISTLDGTLVGEIYGRTWLRRRFVGDRQIADAALVQSCLHEHAASVSFRSLFRRAEMARLKDLDRLLRALGGDGIETDASPEELFERALLFIAEMRMTLRFYETSDHHLPGGHAADDIRSIVEADAGHLARVTLASRP